MQKAEPVALIVSGRGPVRSYFFEQGEGTIYIRAYKVVRPPNGTIYVTLCREVDDCARLMLLQKAAYQTAVEDVAVDELVLPVVGKRFQVTQVPGISELVQVHNRERVQIGRAHV